MDKTVIVGVISSLVSGTSGWFSSEQHYSAGIDKRFDAMQTDSDRKFNILLDQIKELLVDMKQEVGTLRTEMGALRGELKQEIEALRSETRADFKDVNTRIDRLYIDRESR